MPLELCIYDTGVLECAHTRAHTHKHKHMHTQTNKSLEATQVGVNELLLRGQYQCIMNMIVCKIKAFAKCCKTSSHEYRMCLD